MKEAWSIVIHGAVAVYYVFQDQNYAMRLILDRK